MKEQIKENLEEEIKIEEEESKLNKESEKKKSLGSKIK